jgi:hypothetical protein
VTDATKDKVNLVLLALEYNQRLGNLPGDSHHYVNPQFLEDLSYVLNAPVSASTWRQIEADAVFKLQLSQEALAAWNLLTKPQS